MKHWNHKEETFSIIYDFGYYHDYEDNKYEEWVIERDRREKLLNKEVKND